MALVTSPSYQADVRWVGLVWLQERLDPAMPAPQIVKQRAIDSILGDRDEQDPGQGRHVEGSLRCDQV